MIITGHRINSNETVIIFREFDDEIDLFLVDTDSTYRITRTRKSDNKLLIDERSRFFYDALKVYKLINQ